MMLNFYYMVKPTCCWLWQFSSNVEGKTVCPFKSFCNNRTSCAYKLFETNFDNLRNERRVALAKWRLTWHQPKVFLEYMKLESLLYNLWKKSSLYFLFAKLNAMFVNYPKRYYIMCIRSIFNDINHWWHWLTVVANGTLVNWKSLDK